MFKNALGIIIACSVLSPSAHADGVEALGKVCYQTSSHFAYKLELDRDTGVTYEVAMQKHKEGIREQIDKLDKESKVYVLFGKVFPNLVSDMVEQAYREVFYDPEEMVKAFSLRCFMDFQRELELSAKQKP